MEDDVGAAQTRSATTPASATSATSASTRNVAPSGSAASTTSTRDICETRAPAIAPSRDSLSASLRPSMPAAPTTKTRTARTVEDQPPSRAPVSGRRGETPFVRERPAEEAASRLQDRDRRSRRLRGPLHVDPQRGVVAGSVVADDHSGAARRIVNGELRPVPLVDPAAELALVRVLGHIPGTGLGARLGEPGLEIRFVGV